MDIKFKSLIEFNNKHPGMEVGVLPFIYLHIIADKDEYVEKVIPEILNFISIDDLKDMENNNIIKIVGDSLTDISIRSLGRELLGVHSLDTIMAVAEGMRQIFPPKVRSGGGLVRSSLKDTTDKLKKFLKKYNYPYDVILQATANYVHEKEANNYEYMKQLAYFIEKDGVSLLAAECENVINRKEIDIKELKEDRL